MNILKLMLFTVLIVSCGNTQKVTKQSDLIVAPFDGNSFDNIEPFPDKSFFEVMSWQLKSIFYRQSWPKKVEQTIYKPEVERSESLKVAVINHSTVLIQMNNINIITDPQFSKRASPISWAGPKRVIQPGISFEDLPPIDAVLISHNHYDHMDIPSIKMITKRWNSKVYVGLGNKFLLNKNNIKNIVEMDWWDKLDFNGISFHFVPVQHWSARSVGDKRETLWGGFVIEGLKKVFFAGDTGYGKVFKMINERLGNMDLSLIPIGAYQPRSFMKNAHVWPEESVKIFLDTKSTNALGIHFGTFADLTDEYIDQPGKDLAKALSAKGIPSLQFKVPEFGKTYSY